MGEYRTIDVRPVAGALGAEIHGVDLSRPLGNEQVHEIHRAFNEYLVIFFRDQKLTPDQYLAFARHFAEPVLYPFSPGIDSHPEILEIVKEPHETKNFGGEWHSDTSYLPGPAVGTMLYALETPDHGGDTMFANMYLAYDRLSDGMKAMLRGLKGVNSAALKAGGGRKARSVAYGAMKLANLETAENMEAVHPVVRTHPETGKPALYMNITHTVRFEGMTEDESRPLIRWLTDHAVRPEHTCRFRWAPGSIAIWDNRCTQHYAINDYQGQRRRMYRITVGDEAPA